MPNKSQRPEGRAAKRRPNVTTGSTGSKSPFPPLNDTRHTAAQPDQPVDDSIGNWVDLYAPVAARPYLRLSRLDRPVGTWLLFLPCLWGVLLAALAGDGLTQNSAWIITVCAFGSILMRGAGCTWNDMSDHKFDAQVERTKHRPIPAGQVTLPQAALWLVAQVTIAGLLLLTLNTFTIILAISALIPVAIYPFAKRFTWWPQAFLGIAFNWGALVGWSAQNGSLAAAPLFLYIAGIAWTLFYDTIYAHQDLEDDALIGVKSTARLFQGQTSKWLRIFLVSTLFLMALAAFSATQDRAFHITVIAIFGVWAMGLHLAVQLVMFRAADTTGLARIFRSNRTAGLLPALFFACALIM